MRHICRLASRPPQGGYVTFSTLIVASASAVALVLLSGCHSAPANNAFAATPVERSTEAKLKPRETMPPLQPFDEQFVAVRAPASDQ